jgi:CubicO group peptidase (beta-lactamase class C family)
MMLVSEGDRLDNCVCKKIDAGLFPGAVIAAGRIDGNVLLKAYGHAQVEPGPMPMQIDTSFIVESVTKVVAAGTALAICLDEGRVALDQPVKKYLSGLSGPGAERILLRHLVTHTSGIPWRRVLQCMGDGDFFASVLASSPEHEPGACSLYSNRNAILAGMIVEAVTGMAFGRFCHERIFAPLGMDKTCFSPITDNRPMAACRSGRLGWSANEDVLFSGRPIGTAGLVSTAPDLERFCRLWLGHGRTLFSKPVWETAVHNLSPVPEEPYGLFWSLSSTADHRPKRMSRAAFGHGGHTGQSLWIDPEKGSIYNCYDKPRTSEV